jgi:hypothetical protein
VVRVKVLNVSLPLPRHLSNFQHEHQLVAESLRGVAGVVRILARLSRPGVEALVVEDFGGESLDKWLARDGPFAGDLGRFLALAVAVARTLGRIHSRSVVHKDIKVPPSPPLSYAPPPRSKARKRELHHIHCRIHYALMLWCVHVGLTLATPNQLGLVPLSLSFTRIPVHGLTTTLKK